MKEIILNMLELAIQAPSGDNCQPWKFVVEWPTLWIHNLPEKDTSLYNFDQKASMIAHGALLESLGMAAAEQGYKIEIELFPDTNQPELVAQVVFSEEKVEIDPLASFLRKRKTNRRTFEPRPLSSAQKESLTAAASTVAGARLYLPIEEEQKKRLAELLCQNDHLVFENPFLHKFLFDHIRFSPREAEVTRDGLDLRSFELAAPDRVAFRFLRNWTAVKVANSLGFLSKKVTKQALQLCLSSSAIGVVTMPGDDDKEFIAGGRAMQRVWLEATRQGLQLHPMAGLGCLIYRVGRGATQELSGEHVQLIRDIENKLRNQFNCGDETMIMLFRLGYAPDPSVTALRNPVEEVVEFKQ